jgi:putative ABC transport system permease protein
MTVIKHLYSLIPFVRLGVSDVMRHKMRSLLTMLGMVFGVGSVIAMLAVGEGASHQALESIRRLGSQNIILMSVKPSTEEGGSGSEQGKLAVYGLLYDDEKRINATIPGVRRTVSARMTQREARSNDRLLEVRVVETVPEWFDVFRRPLLAGRVLTQHDMQERTAVCVLTEQGVRKLLAAKHILGERVRIGDYLFEVAGVVRNAGDSTRTLDSEADVYMPISTGTKLFGGANLRFSSGGMQGERIELSSIIVEMQDVALVEPGARAIEAV